jgi:hypothetical protein
MQKLIINVPRGTIFKKRFGLYQTFFYFYYSNYFIINHFNFLFMNFKELLPTAIAVLVALVVWEMFLKKMIVKDSFESDLEEMLEE